LTKLSAKFLFIKIS